MYELAAFIVKTVDKTAGTKHFDMYLTSTAALDQP
jgi:hypothetical protein